ncbi:MAG TPA: TolC family protein [Bryobacteraceae bacterium]|jgi:cobalt-zinc-cadmium efflux system outer membrane protein|nr:TolC family protein [Bryobacteraceae bacterium]
MTQRRLEWLLLMATLASNVFAQPGSPASQAPTPQALTWDQVRDRFQASNPTLRAAQISIDESRSQEITAYLRPNPDLTAAIDQINPFSTQTPPSGGSPAYAPFAYAFPASSITYLHERRHKRELRRESAQKETEITVAQYADQERNLLFNLRTAFVQALQQKAILNLTRENLAYYNHLLEVSNDRLKAGDIAKVDYQRLELQRVQYETDVQTATVSLRTAKIQLLMLLNDRTPVEQFDITGAFDFSDQLRPLEELRRLALENRPDLKAAAEAVDKAQTDHRLAIANGSVDPTFGADFARNPPIPVYFGINVSIPLKIFDRNQGEKLRTQQDITRNERLRDAATAQVYSDVDSAYATMQSNLTLLRPYKDTYLKEAVDVRDTVSFAYTRGGSSLLDFLQAQQDYRSTELNYLNLVGSYLTTTAQLNLAVGQEVVIP